MFACLSGMYKYLGWIKLQCYCVHVNLFKLNAFSLVFSTCSSLAKCWPYLCTNYGSFYLGSLDTTRVLLEAGAKVNAENNLGRTAAQLGAFVGMRKLYLPCSTASNDAVVLCYIVCTRMKEVRTMFISLPQDKPTVLASSTTFWQWRIWSIIQSHKVRTDFHCSCYVWILIVQYRTPFQAITKLMPILTVVCISLLEWASLIIRVFFLIFF